MTAGGEGKVPQAEGTSNTQTPTTLWLSLCGKALHVFSATWSPSCGSDPMLTALHVFSQSVLTNISGGRYA